MKADIEKDKDEREGRRDEREKERERLIFHVLVRSLNHHNGWRWNSHSHELGPAELSTQLFSQVYYQRAGSEVEELRFG